jgi:hypothetical protein
MLPSPIKSADTFSILDQQILFLLLIHTLLLKLEDIHVPGTQNVAVALLLPSSKHSACCIAEQMLAQQVAEEVSIALA